MALDTLLDRPLPADPELAETAARFRAALDSLVAKLKQDRYVIAAIVFGSLSHDTVWRKSDIDLILIGRDEKQNKAFHLVENGVNIHAYLYPRSKFKQAIERPLQGSFMHSSFALSTLIYTTDDTIRAYYEDARRVGSRDRQMRLMTAGAGALSTLAKAEKWLVTRHDAAYSFVWLMYALQYVATVEVLLHDQLTTREVIPQALALNPAFFGVVYRDLIHQPAGEAAVRRALDLMNGYVEDKAATLFAPILDYLAAEGGTRTTTELDAYFRTQAQADWLGPAYEWLADRGTIQRVSVPVRLHPKSQIAVDEAAYYYDGVPA